MKLIVVVDLQNEFLGWQPEEIKKSLPEKVVNYLKEQMEKKLEKIKKRIYTRDENGVLHKKEGDDQKND